MPFQTPSEALIGNFIPFMLKSCMTSATLIIRNQGEVKYYEAAQGFRSRGNH